MTSFSAMSEINKKVTKFFNILLFLPGEATPFDNMLLAYHSTKISQGTSFAIWWGVRLAWILYMSWVWGDHDLSIYSEEKQDNGPAK